MAHYITKTPYVAPSYGAMMARQALLPATTQALYQQGVEQINTFGDLAISDITYESDGLKVTGLEILPPFKPDEKAPLILYNRGGSGDFGMLSPAQIGMTMAPLAQRTRAGVLASNYRGNGGSEGREEWGGSDVNDIVNLMETGKRQPWWDGTNIFMLGWSRGGMMTYLTLKRGVKVNAVAVGAGLSDVFEENIRRPEMEKVCAKFIPNYHGTREESLTERSVSCWPEKIHTPLLLLHGTQDTRVDVGQSRRLHQQLTALGKPVKYIEFPGDNHGLTKNRRQVIDAIVNWFGNHRK